MKALVIYYSQSGNTYKVAKQIGRGLRDAGADVRIIKLKDACYEMLEEYDLVGFGSPTWKADTPNMHAFIDKLPEQNGKHAFCFCTHGTLPHLYFPIVVPNLKRRGFNVIGYKDWYGDVYMPGMPKPYYTCGHPDDIDLQEAYDFGREMAENSPRIAAGEESLIYPEPEMNAKVFRQAMICSNMLLCPTNPQGAFVRDPEKCLYPKCTICMDNCLMNYIDLSKDPQVFGNRGDKCDDCHECSYCYMLCPSGAITTDPDHKFAHDINAPHEAFEKMLEEDEVSGKFRRLIPLDQVGYATPYVYWHPERPYMKVPKMTDNLDEE